ncbi:rod-binding protein [Ancylobacter sp. SL191]|uniref:rod-binding protein n=1 Tax=Ancylobacter sp. SL191 TaxID=2995166 RepID=UPI0022703FB4|nr:rod-binding protein [Ancylobacter sp. SL191]WAC29050.1 rod-binding protein [Ancylobacter sp. SL191]
MSIQLPSDLILDVVKAADPQKAQAIATRLRQASAANPATLPADAMSFDAALANSSTALAPARALPMEGLSPLAGTSSLALRNATALSDKPTGATPEAYRRFESMVLSGFVDSILPEAKASLFGSGTAGQVWRSMLAERIADEVAKHGGVGLAERIAGSATRGAANLAVQSAGLAGDTTGVRS